MRKITALMDPNQNPNQLQDQETFDTNMANWVDGMVLRGEQENALADDMEALFATMSATAAGGAYSFPFIFDSSTADSDPGIGKLRLGSTTQNASTVMRMDVQIVGGADISTALADLRAVTSTVKGSIRLVKMTDQSKWIIFDVTAVALPSGYRNLTVSARSSSAASPFVNGDAIMVYIDRNGDSGTVPGATELLATIPVPAGVAAVNALNVFDVDHDWYFVHFSDVACDANTDISLLLALNGSTVASGYYVADANTSNTGADRAYFGLISGSGSAGARFAGVMQIGDVNSTTAFKHISWDGICRLLGIGATSLHGSAKRGALYNSARATGFSLGLTNGTARFTGGTIRVYGVRKA